MTRGETEMARIRPIEITSEQVPNIPSADLASPFLQLINDLIKEATKIEITKRNGGLTVTADVP